MKKTFTTEDESCRNGCQRPVEYGTIYCSACEHKVLCHYCGASFDERDEKSGFRWSSMDPEWWCPTCMGRLPVTGDN